MEKCEKCGEILPPLNGVEENDFARVCSVCEHDEWEDDLLNNRDDER